MTNIQNPKLQQEDLIIQALAFMAAGILLNIGLYFLLWILTPIIVGIVIGYLLGGKIRSTIVSMLSSAIAYSLIFIVTSGSSDLFGLISAILIMIIIGAIGGYLGCLIRNKSALSST